MLERKKRKRLLIPNSNHVDTYFLTFKGRIKVGMGFEKSVVKPILTQPSLKERGYSI